MIADVIIPALNEEAALGQVLAEIPLWKRHEGPVRVRQVIVSDNGSTDRTAAVALEAGAVVVREPRRGYGAACLRALAHLAPNPPEVVVFMDGDRSDRPEELPSLLAPIEQGRADIVVGSRTRGDAEPGSITLQQRFGNALACRVLAMRYGVRYTDLGPFRAIRWSCLNRLGMRDLDYGWTVEMQIRAAEQGLRAAEVPVSYRRRVGHSKVSGTVRGTVSASAKILWWLFRYA